MKKYLVTYTEINSGREYTNKFEIEYESTSGLEEVQLLEVIALLKIYRFECGDAEASMKEVEEYFVKNEHGEVIRMEYDGLWFEIDSIKPAQKTPIELLKELYEENKQDIEEFYDGRSISFDELDEIDPQGDRENAIYEQGLLSGINSAIQALKLIK